MLILFYLLMIGVVSSVAFFVDKQKAKFNRRRISEKTLHLFELAGGVFAILPLMYIIRHKNRKSEYFMITYGIAVLWVAFLVVKFIYL